MAKFAENSNLGKCVLPLLLSAIGIIANTSNSANVLSTKDSQFIVARFITPSCQINP